MATGILSPFSSEAGGSAYPIWTPDGKRIVYTGFRKGFRNIYWRNADRTGEEERLTRGDNHQYPVSFSPDGKYLVFGEVDPKTGNDIWVLRLDGDRRQEPLHNTKLEEFMGHFSTDGYWLAYSSLETGQPEVYVESFPERSHKQQISTEGGLNPSWSRNSPELFYRNGNKMMAVSFRIEPTFIPDKPRLLFEKQFGPGDVTPDGRFLMVQAVEPEQPTAKINLVLNWFEELEQKVPVD